MARKVVLLVDCCEKHLPTPSIRRQSQTCDKDRCHLSIFRDQNLARLSWLFMTVLTVMTHDWQPQIMMPNEMAYGYRERSAWQSIHYDWCSSNLGYTNVRCLSNIVCCRRGIGLVFSRWSFTPVPYICTANWQSIEEWKTIAHLALTFTLSLNSITQ